MNACITTHTLIQKVRHGLSHGVGAEVTGAFACALTRISTCTANHSLNGVISDKYEAIITADVFLDHNYLLVLQREHSEAVPPLDGADMSPLLNLLSFFIRCLIGCFSHSLVMWWHLVYLRVYRSCWRSGSFLAAADYWHDFFFFFETNENCPMWNI